MTEAAKHTLDASIGPTSSWRSRTATSIIAYSIYLGIGGIWMGTAPDSLTSFLHVPPPDGVWIRMAGCLAFVLACKGIYGALHGLTGLMQMDVYTRTGFAVFLTVLVLVGIARPPYYLFLALVDFAAAMWTAFSLRADRKASQLGRQPQQGA
jgi:hypothetical protein